MEDGEDRYARDREEGRDDQTHDADDLIYEEDENELDNNEQPTGDDNDDNNDAVEQDAGADDNDADNHRRGRNQRITETVPDKDVNNLYITNLSFQTTDESLRGVFEPYGKITNCQVIKEPITQTSRGFGFVSFSTLEECEKALQGMNGGECDGRAIRVERAKRNSGYSKTPGVYLGPPQLSSRFGDYKGRLPRDIDPRDFRQRGPVDNYPDSGRSLPPRQYGSGYSDRPYPSRDPYPSSGGGYGGGYRGPPAGYHDRAPPSYRDDRYDDRYDYNRIPRGSLPPARYEDSRDRRDSRGPPPRDYPPLAGSYAGSYDHRPMGDHRPLSARRSRSPPPYDDRRPPAMYSSAYHTREGPPRSRY